MDIGSMLQNLSADDMAKLKEAAGRFFGGKVSAPVFPKRSRRIRGSSICRGSTRRYWKMPRAFPR